MKLQIWHLKQLQETRNNERELRMNVSVMETRKRELLKEERRRREVSRS